MKKLTFQDMLHHFYAFFVFAVTLWIFVQTLAPTVSFFDSGELITASYTFGVAHPPGYPLYVILGWLFSKLPIGTVAYRLNLMSAFFAALAVLMVYYITHTLLLQRKQRQAAPLSPELRDHPDPERMVYPVISLSVALLFAFSLTHWQQAIIAEVYALNAFLCGLIMLLLLKWRSACLLLSSPSNPPHQEGELSSSPVAAPCQEEGSSLPHSLMEGSRRKGRPVPHSWMLYLIALIFGLGFGNHQTISLFAPAACVIVLGTFPRILRSPKTVVAILVCVLLGLSIYGIIPIQASRKPPVNWGNPVTVQQFKWLLLREGYNNVPRGNALSSLWKELWEQSGATRSRVQIIRESLFWRQLKTFSLLREFGYTGAALAFLGLLYGLFRHRFETLMLILAILSFIIIVILIGDPQDENIFLLKEFHSPAYLLSAVLIGLGCMAIAALFLWLAGFSRNLQYGLVFLLALAFLTPCAIQMLKNVRTVDRRRNYVAYDYADNVLKSLPPDAILFTWGDSGAFPLWYLQVVEGRRPDVTLVHTPHLSASWYVENLPAELFSSQEFPLEYEGDVFHLIDDIVFKHAATRPIFFDYSSSHSLPLPYELLPHGVIYKLFVEGDRLDETVWERYSFRGILDDTVIARDPDIERTYLMYGSAHIELGNYYLAYSELKKAEREFNLAIEFAPELGDGIARMLQFQDKIIGSALRTTVQPRLK